MRNKGTTQGSNEAATTQNTFDYETEYGTNPQDIPHVQRFTRVLVPGSGFWTSGWRVGGIVNARSGVPINVVIARPDNVTVGTATLTNIGWEQPRRQRPDGAGSGSIPEGRRSLVESGSVHDAAAAFGNLPRNALEVGVLAGGFDVQQGFPIPRHTGASGARRDFQHHQPAELRKSGSHSPTEHPACRSRTLRQGPSATCSVR